MHAGVMHTWSSHSGRGSTPYARFHAALYLPQPFGYGLGSRMQGVDKSSG